MKRHLKLYYCLWLLLSAATTMIADVSDGGMLYVNLTNSVVYSYGLDDVCKLTFSGEGLAIQQIDGEQTAIRFDDLRHLTFEPCIPEDPTNIEAMPDNKNTIGIFPNPVGDELRISGYEPQKGELIDIFDISGRLVLSSDMPVVKVSQLTKGLYFVKAGHRSEAIKMIKR